MPCLHFGCGGRHAVDHAAHARLETVGQASECPAFFLFGMGLGFRLIRLHLLHANGIILEHGDGLRHFADFVLALMDGQFEFQLAMREIAHRRRNRQNGARSAAGNQHSGGGRDGEPE